MGIQLIPNNLNINFVGVRKITYIISLVLLVASILYVLFSGGLKYGIDFAGGTVIQIEFNDAVDDQAVKAAISSVNLPGGVVQSYVRDGVTGYMIRFQAAENEESKAFQEQINLAITTALPATAFTAPKMEMVGPKVGDSLRSKALEAMYFATLLIGVYISGRFEKRWTAAVIMAASLSLGMYVLGLFHLSKSLLVIAALIITIALCFKLRLAYALGAILSMLHDLLLTVGLYAMMGGEFDLTIVAALMTVVGYSLNDTIIVFDRIRENLHRDRRPPLPEIINIAINQTLSRTVLTSGTTLVVVASLLFLGGDVIHDFALVLFFGIIVGTYSSIFIAAPVLIFFEKSIRERMAIDDEDRKITEAAKNQPMV